jgi:hypothetical protein
MIRMHGALTNYIRVKITTRTEKPPKIGDSERYFNELRVASGRAENLP